MLNKYDQEFVEELIAQGDIDYAEKELRNYIRDEMEEYLTELDDRDLIELLGDEEDIHLMQDLDDVFRHYSPSEVLEELRNIELCDEYFNGNTKTSANDIWDLTEYTTARDVAEGILDEDIYWCDPVAERIREKSEEMLEKVKEGIEIYKKARLMFEKVLANADDPNEVLMMLWNMNM